jgi:HEAT repeat protein
MEAAKSSNPMARRQAALDLGESRNPAAVATLEVLLTDTQPSVRAASCEALGLLRSRASVPKIATALSGDVDPRVRQAAALSFVYIGDPAATGPLIGALRDGAVPVRHAAIRALGKLRAAGAVGALSAALTDPDPLARKTVVSSLGEIGSKEGVPALSSALSDPDAGVRGEAAKSLGLIGDAGARPALTNALKDADAGVRVQAATALAKTGDLSGLPAAYAALKSPDAGVRQQAASTVGLVGDVKGLAALEAARAVEKNAGAQALMDFELARIRSRLGTPAKAPAKAVKTKKAPASKETR